VQPLTRLDGLRQPIVVLSAIEQSAAPFVSCFLNAGVGADACGAVLERRARSLRARLPDSAGLDFDAAMTPIRRYVRDELRSDACGAALFSRSPYGGALFLPLQFAAPLPNVLHAGPLPELFHLIALRDRYHRYLVLFATAAQAKLVEIDLGAASVLAATGVERRDGDLVGGDRFAAFARDQVALLGRVAGARRHAHLMLAGDPQVMDRCREAFPPALATMLIGAVPVAGDRTIDDLVAVTTAVFVDWEEEESQAAAARWVEAVRDNGRAAVGPAACLEALRRREVRLLLVSRRHAPQPGWRCGSCAAMRLRRRMPEACPECGGTVWRIDATSEILRLAGQRGCDVEFVEHSDPLRAMGGVGCELRPPAAGYRGVAT